MCINYVSTKQCQQCKEKEKRNQEANKELVNKDQIITMLKEEVDKKEKGLTAMKGGEKKERTEMKKREERERDDSEGRVGEERERVDSDKGRDEEERERDDSNE